MYFVLDGEERLSMWICEGYTSRRYLMAEALWNLQWLSEEISIGAVHSTGWQKEAAVQPCEVNPCRAGLLTTRPHSNHQPSVCQIFSDCTFTHWESPPRQTHTHTRSFLLLVFLKADFTSASLLSRHKHTCAQLLHLSATPLLIFSWLQGK